MPPLANCQNQTGLKAKLNRTFSCKTARVPAYAAKLVKYMVANRMHVCNLVMFTCQLHICQLHDFTASKPSKQHNHTSFSTLLSDIQGIGSRASTSCSDVHDSSGYKCFRRGSHHQVVSPLCSRVSAGCPLVQQLPQYRAVSKSALGNLFRCDVLWGDLGSIRPSADARLTK